MEGQKRDPICGRGCSAQLEVQLEILRGPARCLFTPTVERLGRQPWQDDAREEALPRLHDDDDQEELGHDHVGGQVVLWGRNT